MGNDSAEREVNLDLLRVFAMFLIVSLHSIDHSGVLETAESMGGLALFYTRFVYGLCQICVNCFVLISGYFLVNAKVRIKKIINLWMEIVFYSFSLKLFMLVIMHKPISVVSIISCLFPVVSGRYWFMTIYIGLYLISPFLNIGIKAMNKWQHTMLLVIMGLLFSVWISVYPTFAGMNSGAGWGLPWFIVLYITAAWFRLYYEKNAYSFSFFCFWVLSALVICILYCISVKIVILHRFFDNMYRYDNILVYLSSIMIMTAFINTPIKGKNTRNLIMKLSPLTLGVYLIHAHADISPWLWKNINLPQYMNKPYFPFIQIACVIVIYMVCSAIDYIRQKTIGRVEDAGVVSRVTNCITSLLFHVFRVELYY